MKTAIVTGANGNLGQAVIKKFIMEGYMVTGTMLPGEPVRPDLPADQYEAVELDLLNEEQSESFTRDFFKKHERIDAAVLTVGGFAMGKIEDTPAAAINKQYRLNFETAYHLARPVFVQMLKQGHGKIFFVGAKPGLNASFSKGMVAYGLAKSLIFRLAEMMNDEAAGSAVSAFVIVPGTIDTPLNRIAMPRADYTKWKNPDELAEIIYDCFTASIRQPMETVIRAF